MDLYLLLKLDITINGPNSCWRDFPYIVKTWSGLEWIDDWYFGYIEGHSCERVAQGYHREWTHRAQKLAGTDVTRSCSFSTSALTFYNGNEYRNQLNHETSTPAIQDITSCYCPFCLSIDSVLKATPKHHIHPCGRHGIFRYRLLRRWDEYTPSRPTGGEWPSPVSYTHLTLPTICSV